MGRCCVGPFLRGLHFFPNCKWEGLPLTDGALCLTKSDDLEGNTVNNCASGKLRATRPIAKGEELFWNYGGLYERSYRTSLAFRKEFMWMASIHLAVRNVLGNRQGRAKFS